MNKPLTLLWALRHPARAFRSLVAGIRVIRQWATLDEADLSGILSSAQRGRDAAMKSAESEE